VLEGPFERGLGVGSAAGPEVVQPGEHPASRPRGVVADLFEGRKRRTRFRLRPREREAGIGRRIDVDTLELRKHLDAPIAARARSGDRLDEGRASAPELPNLRQGGPELGQHLRGDVLRGQ
jgi:hypothetical protein